MKITKDVILALRKFEAAERCTTVYGKVPKAVIDKLCLHSDLVHRVPPGVFRLTDKGREVLAKAKR